MKTKDYAVKDAKPVIGFEHILSATAQNLPPYRIQHNDDGTIQALVTDVDSRAWLQNNPLGKKDEML